MLLRGKKHFRCLFFQFQNILQPFNVIPFFFLLHFQLIHFSWFLIVIIQHTFYSSLLLPSPPPFHLLSHYPLTTLYCHPKKPRFVCVANLQKILQKCLRGAQVALSTLHMSTCLSTTCKTFCSTFLLPFFSPFKL